MIIYFQYHQKCITLLLCHLSFWERYKQNLVLRRYGKPYTWGQSSAVICFVELEEQRKIYFAWDQQLVLTLMCYIFTFDDDGNMIQWISHQVLSCSMIETTRIHLWKKRVQMYLVQRHQYLSKKIRYIKWGISILPPHFKFSSYVYIFMWQWMGAVAYFLSLLCQHSHGNRLLRAIAKLNFLRTWSITTWHFSTVLL